MNRSPIHPGGTVCLLLISDGREDYLRECLLSAAQHLPAFDQFVHVEDPDHELGFAGAIQAGWDQVDTDYVFHVEQDFVFTERVRIDRMLSELLHHPHLTQLALLRQPWNEAEREAGGIVEMDPTAFKLRKGKCHPYRWLEHRKFWTTNPSLYPRWIVDRGWPQCPDSEGHFGISLFADYPRHVAAFWGDGTPTVEHIGRERVGTGY